jgi:SSS family solute:Na+ symporter
VAAYVALGGLRSAIYNEVLQFCLIWGGALLVPILGLVEAGGFHGLQQKIIANLGNDNYLHLWKTTAHFTDNPMGIHWTSILFGLGFVVSFGYWTTDFLVVQRVLSAHNLRAAQMAPVIGSFFKMAVPFIVILPGLLGLVVLKNPDGSLMHLVGQNQLSAANPHSYNEVLPLMLVRYFGPGLLGLGVTALLAGFMSGMAGNVSAFSTVWTYDLYRPHIRKNAPDAHYVAVGRWATILGVLVSICAAYLVMHAAGIMDYVQALFSLFLAPLLGVILLGMFWNRATAAGGFWGLLSGIVTRVAKSGGKVVLVDNYGPEDDALDTLFQHIEKTRDPSHVRGYRLSIWRKFLQNVGLTIEQEVTDHYSESPRGMDFDDWVRRARTPSDRVAELRLIFTTASLELRDWLRIQIDGDSIWFRIPQVTLVARR